MTSPTSTPDNSPSRRNVLTPRELQVLQGISNGATNREIGDYYTLSEDTIKTHVRRLLRKLKARDRAHAVRRAFELGLFGDGPLPRMPHLRPRPETPLAEAQRQADLGRQLVAALTSLGWTPPRPM